MDAPTPGNGNRAAIGRLILRSLPDRAPASSWCGQHARERTRLVLRRAWVCLDCLRERPAETE